MLEPVNQSPKVTDGDREVTPLIFRNIVKDQVGTGLCFVRDGNTKVSRASKPFITLYLQDITGAVVPGYVFNLDNFKYAGQELSQVIRQLVIVDYEENYLPRYGMSVRLTNVKLLSNAPADLLGKFVGNVENVQNLHSSLMAGLSAKYGIKVRMPLTIETVSHLDYSQGKLGGLVYHYYRMLLALSAYEDMFNEQDRKTLYGVFLLYIHAHSNYIQAEAKGNVDITFATQLTSSIAGYMSKLKLPQGAAEVSTVFFGYEPKDIFVRTVCQVSDSIRRVQQEVAVWDALPLTREGSAGYGTIRRYAEE